MRLLAQFIRQHLLLNCLVISMALHGLVIFYSLSDKTEQSAKGEEYTLLLDTHTQPNPTPQQRVVTKSDSITDALADLKVKDTLFAKTKPSTDLPVKSTANEKLNVDPHINPKVAANNNRKSNTGSHEDMSGKALTAQEQYRKIVLQHILKKVGSSPYFGSSVVDITLIRAGIAIQINVKLLNGSAQYKRWLNSRILNANPMPAFPKTIAERQLKLNFPIHHIKDL
jgi:hypothetical protein